MQRPNFANGEINSTSGQVVYVASMGVKAQWKKLKTAKLEAYQFDEEHSLPKEKLNSLTVLKG